MINWFNSTSTKHDYCFSLKMKNGIAEYYNPFLNFLIYGGMGCGKTKSIGKPLLAEYLRHKFAGFIYDFKDLDFTKTAYNLLMDDDYSDYPYNLKVINFTNPEISSRTNPISPDVINDENIFIQLIADMMKAYMFKGAGQVSDNDFFSNSAIGLLQSIAFVFYKYIPQYCTIPHIISYATHKSPEEITKLISVDPQAAGLAAGFLQAVLSPATQGSILGTLGGFLADLSFNKNVLYVLSGNDFSFNLIDPNNPKLVSVSNSIQIDRSISPVIALMLSVSTRQFTMRNKVPFFYMLDEATTFKISDFQMMCSVLREYLCSFTFMTQSSSKIEHQYTINEKSIIEANFANHFYGRTTDIRAIEKLPILFGRKDMERISKTKGGVGIKKSSSKTVSFLKENVYDPDFFTELKAGQFVCSASHSNKKKFVGEFKMFDFKEEHDLPILYNGNIRQAIDENYKNILDQIDFTF